MRRDRLAPLAFVVGTVLFGLSILALSLVATAPGHGPVEEHETTIVGDHVVLAYPVPVSPHVATRIDVTFEYPQHGGDAMIVGCGGYSALLQGREPSGVGNSNSGASGSLSSVISSKAFGEEDAASRCPFRYAVLRWDLRGESPAANRPEVTVETSPVFVAAMLWVTGGTAAAGLALAFFGGTRWARSLRRERGTEAAGDDESTSETLLLLIGKTGDWLTRTRRHLIAAGILGIFLWYPVVLSWAWSTALHGSSDSLRTADPWILPLGALVLLLALTVAWCREYLRIDRELVAWRERLERLHEREARLFADLDAAG